MNTEIIENKIKTLIEERETILSEMQELKNAFDLRQNRIIEISGSIKSLQEIANELCTSDDNQN